ncbi:MAG TPA: hypothetical protein VKT73_02065 [Xanthobacteraceae bacterium]|nr:hypothetical protein [Xanthobacteraceae bacterium]
MTDETVWRPYAAVDLAGIAAGGAPAAVVTDSLVAELYGVAAEVGGVPEGPFLLPQTLRRMAGASY